MVNFCRLEGVQGFKNVIKIGGFRNYLYEYERWKNFLLIGIFMRNFKADNIVENRNGVVAIPESKKWSMSVDEGVLTGWVERITDNFVAKEIRASRLS